MVHSIRKYLCNRGSALFMVLTTMTALMITCMAMYFAVVSSRSAGFAVFNQQQSFQSAVSVADMVIGDFNAIMSNSGASIEGTDVGKVILSTNGNGFKSLTSNPSAADDADYIGAYDVTMTRLPDETIDNKKYLTVDIAVTSSVSGVKEVYHQIVNIIEEDETPPSKGKIFASTGYVPNDSFISRGHFYSDVYISNEDVVVGAFSGDQIFFYSNIFCENSLSFLDGTHLKNSAPGPIIHAVRGDYNLLAGDSVDIKGNSYILVGKDMHLTTPIKTQYGSDQLEVYIGGDLYLESGADNLKDANAKFFVAGNVYVNATSANCMPNVIYCNKIVNNTSNTSYNNSGSAIWEQNESKNTSSSEWWQLDQKEKHGGMSMSFAEAMEMLDAKTPDIKYMLWKVDESKVGGQIGTLNADGTVTMKNGEEIKPLEFNLAEATTDNKFEPIKLTYSDSNKGCVVKDIIMKGGNVSIGNLPTIIIDTGDKTSNTYTLRLQNNRVTKDGKGYFTWSPKLEYYDWSTGKAVLTYAETNHPIQILVKGNGSVVIEVPEGVVYQDTSNNRIAHYNWYMLTSGSGITKVNGKDVYSSQEDAFRDGTTFSPYVHVTCGDSCSCRYTSKKTTETCPTCGNAKLYTVTCSDHGEYSICPQCDADCFGTDGKPKTSGMGLCKDRVNVKRCESDLEDVDSATHPVNRDSSGNIIIPNSNIYLVSCSESAEFRFGKTIDDTGDISHSCFAGFIYAPYMSYIANANASGNYLMHMGGMVVSDYKFLSDNSFLACWPSVYPPENVLDETSLNTSLKPVTEKRYRVRLKATY